MSDSRKTVDILGVPVDSITMPQALERVASFLAEDKVHSIFTPNAEIVMQAQRDNELKDILNSADMVVADGAGVVLASKILKRSVPCKVSGIDLTRELLRQYDEKEVSFFIFGSKPGVAEKAALNILSDHQGVKIAGYRDGYFKEEDVPSIIEKINSSGADILLVALGAPKQEKWIARHAGELKVKVCIGVGGSVDVMAGVVKMAPEFFRKAGLEWFYRLCREPWRAKRMMDLPRFMIHVILHRITHNHARNA
jgi:N-acetylglucosaminyldiphosphoundecaprenol N-acetyl-beta-D-mannosaminyltransferase